MAHIGRGVIGMALGILLPAPLILGGLWIVVTRPFGVNPVWGSGLLILGLLLSPLTIAVSVAKKNSALESQRPASPMHAIGFGAAMGVGGGVLLTLFAAATGGVHATHLPDGYVLAWFAIACICAGTILGGLAGAVVVGLRRLFR